MSLYKVVPYSRNFSVNIEFCLYIYYLFVCNKPSPLKSIDNYVSRKTVPWNKLYLPQIIYLCYVSHATYKKVIILVKLSQVKVIYFLPIKNFVIMNVSALQTKINSPNLTVESLYFLFCSSERLAATKGLSLSNELDFWRPTVLLLMVLNCDAEVE